MQTKYYTDDDAVVLTNRHKHGDGGTLRDDFGIILTYESEGSEEVTQIDILRASRLLPLGPERGYDAQTDTLTLGDKPTADYRVVDNGDFVSYRQWFDDGSERDVVAVDLRQASVHLAPVLAALAQPTSVSAG